MTDLSISNVIQISVAEAPAGLNAFNTGNILLITSGTPDPVFDDDYKIYKEPAEVGVDFGTSSVTFKMAAKVFAQSPNLLTPGGSLIIAPFEPSETLDDAIVRLDGIVQFFGILCTEIQGQSPAIDAATVVQALQSPKILALPQRLSTTIDPGGLLDDLRTGGFTRTRGLYYGSAADLDCVCMAAAYLSRGFGVDFSGSRTVLNMNLKDLLTVAPDPTMTQTLRDKAKVAGADIYASVQGVSKVLASGTNKFFDQVQNLSWFVAAIQVAVFNYLATTSTKIPQTEEGMDGLKNAIRQVCKQAITNGYGAPGIWTSSDVFGNPEDLREQIKQFGYYIYSGPIADQSVADRDERKATLCQVALKEAGGIDSASAVLYINA